MKKRLLLLTCGLLPVLTYSQVGINTSDPKQALHVSGTPTNYINAPNVGTSSVKIVEPTIRIDGLNATNNPAHSTNINSLQRVYASKDGDLMLRKGNTNFVLFNETGTINENSVGIPTGSNHFLVPSVILKTVQFTVEKESIVNISAAVNGRLENYTSNQLTINEEVEYHFGINFSFSAAPNEMIDLVDKEFAEATYKIISTQVSIQRTETTLYTNKNLLLSPGTYVLNLNGNYSGRNFKKVVFGNDNSNEFIKIVAIPTNRK